MAQKGFSLFEVLVTILLASSLMILVTKSLYPIQKQVLIQYRTLRLQQQLVQLMDKMEKNIKRAGFMVKKKEASTSGFLSVSHYGIEAPNSCITLRYDANHNGALEPATAYDSEFFIYRLRQGNIEYSRQHASCNGSGWHRLLDPLQIMITQFYIESIDSGDSTFTSLTITATWPNDQAIQQKMMRIIHHDNEIN